MKTKLTLFTLALVTFLAGSVSAQLMRANDRTWHALRGGLYIGLNQSLHAGNVPLSPSPDNTFYTKGSGTNFIFGLVMEKGISRFIVLGLRLGFDPMSASIHENFREVGRISDSQGNLYDVYRDHNVEYSLRYFSLNGYAKLYPYGGPGFFLGGGLTTSALLKSTYSTSAIVTAPDWARGSVGKTSSGEIADINNIRYSLNVSAGYDFYFTYGFVTPELRYDIGLSNVVDAGYADTWSVNNISGLVSMTFPLP